MKKRIRVEKVKTRKGSRKKKKKKGFKLNKKIIHMMSN